MDHGKGEIKFVDIDGLTNAWVWMVPVGSLTSIFAF